MTRPKVFVEIQLLAYAKLLRNRNYVYIVFIFLPVYNELLFVPGVWLVTVNPFVLHQKVVSVIAVSVGGLSGCARAQALPIDL